MKRLLIALLIGLCSTALSGQFYDFLSENKSATFGFSAEHDFILVKVRFANVLPLNFIFDTGSEHTILFKKEYADLLGVEYDRKIPLFGADMADQIYAYIARGIELNVDGKLQFTSDVLVMEADYLHLEEFTGINIDGILGANLFRHLVLQIDNKKDRITLLSPNKFKPPKRHMQFEIDIQQSKPYLTTLARAGGEEITLKLLLDTGASLPLLLYTNTHSNLELPPQAILGNLGMGLGGFLQGYVGRVEFLDFADYRFSNLVTSFQDIILDSLMTNTTGRNGIIGNSLLGRYNLMIDYNQGHLYLKANRKYRRKFKYDKSGLTIAATGADLRSFIIQRVVSDSPAAEAGLQKGDLIKSMKGIPASFYTLAALNSTLSSKVGKVVRIVVSRNGVRLKKKVKLRELI